MIQDKKTFTGGMDQDSDERLVEQGDYRYALNIRNGTSDGSSTLAVENVKGNLLVAYSLPTGDNRCVGNYDDKSTNHVYYFVYNSANQHSILEYNYGNNSIALVLKSSVLNFSDSTKIVHVNVLEGDLSWTEITNPPRAINIAKAKLHSQGNFTLGYPSPFTDEFCRAIRFAPNCEPTCGYADDTTKSINYLSEKLFQFKYRYWYYDFQSSTWSPISTVPLPAVVCGNTSTNAAKNCLLNIVTETGSGIVTRVEIAARLGNTGDFFSIADLDKSKLNISSNTINTFAFYNDKVYNNVDIKESILLYDNIPLKADCQEIVENRKVYADIIEGQDPVQIEAKLDLAYKQDISTTTYSLTGRIYIKNVFATTLPAMSNQPIYTRTSGGPNTSYIWGGAPSVITVGSWVAGAGTDYFQKIPMGGFPVYLAGTPYKAVSKQVLNAGGYGAVQDANNVYSADPSVGGQQNDVIREMIDGNCYSVFTINGISPGDYVLRVASHETTQSQFDDPSRPYELTSTNTVQVGGIQDTEIRIHIAQNGTATINGTPTNVVNKTISIGGTHIIDLTDPRSATASTALTGYATDCDTQPTPSTYAGLLADTRIERAIVQFSNANAAYGPIQGLYTWLQQWSGPNWGYTDHNGYFFFACTDGISGSVSVSGLQSTITVTPTNYNSSGGAFAGVTGNQGAQIVCRAPGSASPFNDYRTTVGAFVYDINSNAIEGASVVIGHSRVEETDPVGQWQIIIYGDTVSSIGIREEYINYSLSDGCTGVFAGSPDHFKIGFSQFATGQTLFSPDYNGLYNNQSSAYWLTVQNQIVTIVGGGASTKADKRGGVYQYGIVYYNDANQSGLTNTTDGEFTDLITTNGYGLKMEIPFYTEPQGNTIVGQLMPEISWELFSLPPVWATHWQWVRTLNSATNGYIQFVAKDIKFTDFTRQNLAPVNSAAKMGINILNIVDYNTNNSDSQGNVTYDFTEGDRIRFIRDAAGNFYNKYFDFKIRDYDSAGIVYIDYVVAVGQPSPGMLFEIYTPKKQLDEELYYEFGECYEVGDAGLSTRYHKGDTQDQDPNNPISTPATGTFTEGDTYYRTRSMGFINTSSSISYANRIVEDPSFSDFFSSRVIDIGRPNRVDNQYRQTQRPTTMYHSEVFIPETFVNGLNRFYDTSFETYDRRFGHIQRIFSDNHTIEVYQEKKCGEVPINQRYLYNAGGDNQLVTTDAFFNDIIYSVSDWGIYFNPESFATFGNSRYFVDIAHGVVVRKNIDGLTPISEYKMHNFFTDLAQQYISNNLFPNVWGTYDRRFDEYVICFEEIESTATDPPTIIPGSTHAFSEKRNKWTTAYSYLPENIGSAGMETVSFVGAGLWKHNSNPLYNNFYGVQYNSEIWPISNIDPSKVKVMLSLSQETTAVWEAYDIITPSGQSSNLLTTDFQLLEGIFYSDILRDSNTPNVTNPLIEGDAMRGATTLFKLRNNSTSLMTLFAVNIGVIASERSNK